MPRPSKTEQELGMLRSAWDYLREIQADHQGVVSIYASTMGRPGVFSFRFVFTPLVETSENYLGSCAVQFLYPTAKTQTLAGTFFAQARELSKVVADAVTPRGQHKKHQA